MNADQLVQMANRIAAFFAAMPDHGEAVDGVATHLRKFWEPRMREQLRALIDAGQPDLHPLVHEAFGLLAARA
ncbi:formate dehydrogenase [Rubrivivax gelatinosus]|uniref:Formate dehydrogenase n=1 Tax=Rubrivivax gelatinosus TaxID=28068 RepID=A0ABS1DXE5_RUBGE|nr:formate dehydrogenase subunit delta [Rubrivivax gelatinosus]MBK1614263.1 formate dehydrogenase [Rubrivivax gelatinosus]MBK1713447.1 formate dehydrogenase [Rubrivivax gelatinosus]